jgi:hypothetical protein
MNFDCLKSKLESVSGAPKFVSECCEAFGLVHLQPKLDEHVTATREIRTPIKADPISVDWNPITEVIFISESRLHLSQHSED